MSDLTHSFKVQGDSRAVRFYLWLYEADPNGINTCKLFWAFLLSPIALFFRTIALLVSLIASLVPSRQAVVVADASGGTATLSSNSVRGPSRFERVIERISIFFSSAWVKKSAQVAFFVFIGGYLLWLLGYFVYGLIVETVVVLAVIGGIALALLVIIGLVLLFNVIDGQRRVGKAWNGALDFVDLMVRLGRSFHDHTCARVEVEH